MTERIKEQIEAVRRSGETNMLDTRMVQWIANRENYYELVIYLEEHREEYVNYTDEQKDLPINHAAVTLPLSAANVFLHTE